MHAIFAAEELLTEMQLATRFRERTATEVEFLVPDRDGDGTQEIIRYSWAGSAGNPLTRSYNGSTPETILYGVASLNLEYMTRTLRGLEAPVIFVPEVVFESFEETKLSEAADSITIATPSEVKQGELLIAAVAGDKNQKAKFQESFAGWNSLLTDVENNNITLGIWWRIASESEPEQHTFAFQQTTAAYGWIMHFSGNDTDAPIHAGAIATGRSEKPSAPEIETTVENTLILRIGAFDDDSVEEDQPSVPDTTVITLDRVAAASGGAVYEPQDGTGKTPSKNFQLTLREDYVAATIAISPAKESQ
jgi:hypothetical protein